MGSDEILLQMKKRLLFASANKHKLTEIRALLEPLGFELLGLHDLELFDDIPETGETLRENAFLKASYLHQQLGLPCFADDSGLEVEALHGAPGVHSARYAGEPRSDANNLNKLLQELAGSNNRKACFKTVICLIDENGAAHYFEGRVDGKITQEARGKGGFGYDPVFVPIAYQNTFAELPAEVKNQISHRARAVQDLVSHLKQHQSPLTEQ